MAKLCLFTRSFHVIIQCMGHEILVQSELVSGLQSVNSKSMEFGWFVFIAYSKNLDNYMYKLKNAYYN